MSVDIETVRRVARLARIAVTQEEAERMTGELNRILGFVEQLNEVDVSGVEPMTSVIPIALKERQDVVTDGDKPEDIVANAPATAENFFLVPEGGGEQMAIEIGVETPLQDDVRALIAELNSALLELTPPEFCSHMTAEQMAAADTTVFVARDRGTAIACGALRRHERGVGEVKRMYTRPSH